MLVIEQKVNFDPNKKSHREEYKYFLQNNTWKNRVCPFLSEWPHLSVDSTIKDKIARHYLKA